MSGEAIVRELLIGDAAFYASCGNAPTRVIVGPLPETVSALPCASVIELATLNRLTLSGAEPGEKVTASIQISVVAKTIPAAALVVKLAHAALRAFVGSTADYAVVTCSVTGRGPTLHLPGGSVSKSIDALVTYDESYS